LSNIPFSFAAPKQPRNETMEMMIPITIEAAAIVPASPMISYSEVVM
jgi:hypothetical protein